MKTKILGILVLTLSLAITACGNENNGNRVTIKEPGKSITVIDDAGKDSGKPEISVEKIGRYEGVEISDWLDEDTVIVSKENDSMDKMSLAELSDLYPRSLYSYNLNTKEYKLLKEQKNVFLGGAVLSADKKHLLYNEFTLGDPVFYVMNLDTSNVFGITGGDIGGAASAKWSGNEVIGTAYSSGAYVASTQGKISVLDELKDEAPVIVERTKDYVYYNTNYDETLMRLNLNTKEKVNLNLSNVYTALPSPDGKQLLVLQRSGSKNRMIICDTDGKNQKTVAEGIELGGGSWSPDQRMIAYNLKGEENNSAVNGLYVYDILTDKSTRIAVDIQNSVTCWSPSGKKLVYAEWNGKKYDSSIVYFNF